VRENALKPSFYHCPKVIPSLTKFESKWKKLLMEEGEEISYGITSTPFLFENKKGVINARL